MAKKSEYWELLRDPRWQKKRLEVMQRDEFSCQQCGDSESTLNVHHRHYFKGRAPWEYADHELVTLCESCHGVVGDQEDARKALFACLRVDGPFSIGEALGLIAGWANQQCGHDLTKFQSESPYNFLLGDVLGYIDVFAWNLEDLLEFRDALAAVDSGKRREAFAEMVKALRAKGME